MGRGEGEEKGGRFMNGHVIVTTGWCGSHRQAVRKPHRYVNHTYRGVSEHQKSPFHSSGSEAEQNGTCLRRPIWNQSVSKAPC